MDTIKLQQLFKIRLYSYWNFFPDPAKLSGITPAWLNFRIMPGLPEQMYSGIIIEHEISTFKYIYKQQMDNRNKFFRDILHSGKIACPLDLCAVII